MRVIKSSGCIMATLYIPNSETVSTVRARLHDAARDPGPINLTSGRRPVAAAPLSRFRRARAQKDETILVDGLLIAMDYHGSPPWIRQG